MTKPHHHPKETPKVELETPTAFMRKHKTWKLVADYCIRHMNKAGFAFIVSMMGLMGCHYNGNHADTQNQEGALWHYVHRLDARVSVLEGDSDAVGKKLMTNTNQTAMVTP